MFDEVVDEDCGGDGGDDAPVPVDIVAAAAAGVESWADSGSTGSRAPEKIPPNSKNCHPNSKNSKPPICTFSFFFFGNNFHRRYLRT